jgi:hypothetical protein
VIEREDSSRDHALRPDWLTDADPLPQTITGKRDDYLSQCRRMIAANAVRRYREDGERGRVSYSRNRNYYANPDLKFYWLPWFTYDYVTRAVDQMDRAGLVFHDRKRPGNRHWQSWFLATAKLLELKPKLQHIQHRNIIMRDEDKNDVAYNDKARNIVRMMGDVDDINAYLAKQTVALGRKILKEGDPLYIDTSCVSGAMRIKARRIFRDRSWYKGGRFYNDLQNIPKQARSEMTLNGFPVAIHDYAFFYPGMLYAMVEQVCDGDPYVIADVPRNIGKRALNILINAKNGTQATRAVAKELKERRIGNGHGERYTMAKQIIAALKERNAPIAEFFHSDAGKLLMWFEAQILHQNMLDLMELDIPFIPLHDAILDPAHAYPKVRGIMNCNLEYMHRGLGQGYKTLPSRRPDLDSASQ